MGLCRSQPLGIAVYIDEWCSSEIEPRLKHNSIVRMWFKRFDKYLRRGVFIKDLLPDDGSHQASSNVLRYLPDFGDVVRGVTLQEDD